MGEKQQTIKSNQHDGGKNQLNNVIEATEQKNFEELHRYESIVANSNDMIALLDKNFTYLSSNNAYMDAFGATP